MAITKKKSEHYVNNKEFLAAMVEYKSIVSESKWTKGNNSIKKPKVPDYIGECIENCLTYLDNFNPDKSNNPFAYFTQIIYYAFVRRIQKEKKQVIIKQRMIQESNYDDLTLQPGEDREFKNQFTEFLKKNMIVEEPVKKKTVKKTKKKK